MRIEGFDKAFFAARNDIAEERSDLSRAELGCFASIVAVEAVRLDAELNNRMHPDLEIQLDKIRQNSLTNLSRRGFGVES